MKRWAIVTLGLVLALWGSPADAQVSFGPQLVWGDDTDLGVGGRIDFGLAGALGIDDGFFQNLFGSATGSYFFWDCGTGIDIDNLDCGYIEFNGNAGVPFTVESSSLSGYFGSGLHVGRTSVDYKGEIIERTLASDTEIGLNLLGGFKFPISDLTGFVEGKFGLVGVEQFVLSFGFLFG